MATQFPIWYGDFWERLPLSSYSFWLNDNLLTAETGGGEILTARRGQRLWHGTAQITPVSTGQADDVGATLDLLREAGTSFMVYDPARRWSQHDPDGSIQGSEVCSVFAVNANLREITLQGLSAGYTLTTGDHVSIAYGSGPVRYYLGKVAVGGTFQAGTPTTATIELVPRLPSTVTQNDTVTLRRPVCKAVYVPESFRGLTRQPRADESFTFRWRQTVR